MNLPLIFRYSFMPDKHNQNKRQEKELNLNQKAIELLEEDRYEEALNTFREAVRGSRDVQSLNNLAWFLTNEEHDYPAALEILEEAVRMKPDSYFPYSLLGEVYLHLQKWGEARDVLEKAIALQPTQISYYNLGVAHYHLGNKEEAAQYFLLGSKPSDCSLYSHIKCLIELGRMNQAKQLLDTFSEEDEEFTGELDVADLYLEMGCYHEAVHWFEKSLNMWAKEPNWVNRFAYSLVKVGNLKRGREILKEAIQEKTENLEERLNEVNEEWDEEDWQCYIGDLISDKQAFEKMLANFPLEQLPPMKFVTTIKEACYLFGCGRHGHPEYHSKE